MSGDIKSRKEPKIAKSTHTIVLKSIKEAKDYCIKNKKELNIEKLCPYTGYDNKFYKAKAQLCITDHGNYVIEQYQYYDKLSKTWIDTEEKEWSNEEINELFFPYSINTFDQYDHKSDFVKGIAKIIKNGKYGFINKDNVIICQPKYDNVSFFENGFAKVQLNKKMGIYQ